MPHVPDFLSGFIPKDGTQAGQQFEVVNLSWALRDDGDVSFGGQTIPLEEFIAQGIMGPDQIKIARERRAKHMRQTVGRTND